MLIQNDVTKVVRAVKHLLSRIQTIGDDVDVVKTDLVVIRAEQGVRFGSPSSTPPEDAADDLMDFITAEDRTGMRGQTDASKSGSPTLVTPTKRSVDDDDDSHEEDGDVRSILAKLIDDVKALQTANQSSAIKFGSLGIRDLSECAVWISKHFSH